MLHQFFPDSGIYNAHMAWDIPPDLDLERFRRAMACVIERHPILRTIYDISDQGRVVQRVLESGEPRIDVVELGEISESRLRQHIELELHWPFRLNEEVPVRWVWCKCEGRPDVLIIIQHHISVDLWSLMILLNDMMLAYGALQRGAVPDWKPLPLQYADHVQEQGTLIGSEAGKSLAEFWRQQLETLPKVLDLPTDFPRPALRTCTKRYHHFSIAPERLARFDASTRALRVAPFIQYETLFHLLLHRYTGQSEIAVGIPTAGRDDRYRGVYGYFSNAVVVAGRIEPQEDFLTLLQRQKVTIKQALDAQDYPFALLAGQFTDNRDPSRAPLVQVCFVWENINRFENREQPLVEAVEDGRQCWRLGAMGEWTRHSLVQQLDDFDLTFKVYKYRERLEFGIEYNIELFDVARIERMAEHFVALMDAVAEQPQCPVARLDMLSAGERQRLLRDWNNTTVALDRGDTFVQQFARVVQRQPEQVALRLGEDSLTYRELDQLSERVAQALFQRDLGSEKIVGVFMERGLAWVISFVGILKAGAGYLPLDPDYPADRLRFIMEDAQPAAILTNQVLQHRLPAQVAAPIFIWEQLRAQTFAPLSAGTNISPVQLAYVIYTSGSTGKPKGVMIEHGNLSHLLLTQRQVFNLGAADTVLQFASMNFDASVFELTIALHSGATLQLASKEELFGHQLLDFLRLQQITWTLLPPALLAVLPAQPLPQLRTLVVGGDACSAEMARKWAAGRTLYNAYGPTECTVWATTTPIDGQSTPLIGKPVANTQVYILDEQGLPQPLGIAGELYIGGAGVARGYLNRAQLTAERFVPDPFSSDPQARLYRTGDLARFRDDGSLEFLGRLDHQVKVRGFRIELGEIETVLRTHAAVHDVLVMARDDVPGQPAADKMLVAYIVKNASEVIDSHSLRQFLAAKLPAYMVPSAFVMLDAFPLTPNEKIDRKALPLPSQQDRAGLARDIQAPRNEIERIIAGIWEQCLGLKDVSIRENFFDLGGHSLLLANVHARLPEFLREKLTMVDLYKYPTIAALANFVDSNLEEDHFFVREDAHVERMRLRRRLMEAAGGEKIAIVGMAGRFPGAETVEQFWHNICGKKESITFFTPEQLRAAGVPDSVIRAPNYVPAKGVLNDVAGFDAAFFRFTPREAQITDPQQRLFLECAWEALEDAGCVPAKFRGRIGVYGGVGINQYLVNNLAAHPELVAAVGDYALMLGNDKDFLCTRVSYKLNLDGPAMVVQTACSTSLVAVHTACQALVNEECDAALAGGVSLSRLGNNGYFYHEGMIMSPDGHCRAFDANAAGTVQGQGCGVVLLKRLDDALRNNDHIYAVISGSATNNDGSNKTGYTAPSVEGQAKAIHLAQVSADIEPSRITYIEAHGTGTPLGDPIELEALRQTFREEAAADASKNERSKKRTWEKTCAIGSVKTNIGHLDAAAGIAGLIKTAKALEQQKLPPSLHFNTPNPKINFEQSPFYVNTELRDWETNGDKRFAAVSSFGMGGTNAHVILTQAPNETPAEVGRPWRLLTLSARTPTALNTMSERLVQHLIDHPDQSFSNICYTLHVGRTLFAHRRHLVCRNREEAIAELMALNPQQVITTHYRERPKKIVFLFSGQGSQYISMGKHLYQVELTFRNIVDECRAKIGGKFMHVYEELTEDDSRGQTEKLHQTYITQPALFIFEYALAKTLMSWGITPDFMLGHSVGEYVAACLAGVFTLDQALELVAIRGQLMQELEPGEMLSVRLPEAEAVLLTNHDVSLAAVNGADRCVLAGSAKAIQYLHDHLNRRGVENRILYTSHAFHSHMMDPVLERFEAYVRRRQPQAPKMPFVSSLTGKWITPEQATSPRYWADHLRNTVRFHQGLSTLFQAREDVDAEQALIFLEVGPGKVLTTLTRLHSGRKLYDWLLATTRHAYEEISDTQHLLKVIGRLWEQGVDINWDEFHSQRQRYRVPLPTYPFERTPHWVEASAAPQTALIHPTAPADTIDEQVVDVPATCVPPRDDVETLVWRGWADSLGRTDFGVHDNFFDLGGDSLTGVNLVDRLNKTFQIPLSAPILIQKPTVAELADHIQRCCDIRFALDDKGVPVVNNSPLVMIQRGSTPQVPLLMVHPIGGEVFFYRDLARNLGFQQPLYAFQAPSLSGAEEPMQSVYALAERYIAELKKAGFKPPYLLGGSSFGGLVAYEMAQQLSGNDEEVRLLVMIDTPAPHQMPANLTDSAAILHYLLQDQLTVPLEKLRQLDPQAQIEFVLDEARVHGKGNVLPPHLGLPLFNTWIAHQQATFNYTPQTYPHDVVFFRHTEPMAHFPPLPHKPWEELVEGKLEVHEVPGNHITMNYPPHVRVLAEHLRIILRKYTVPRTDASPLILRGMVS
jgi:amino acid adenylation domain-containing protein